MNKDTLEGNLKMFQGQVRKQWGKLTDDDVEKVAGHLDLLTGKVQERYGIAKEEAAKQVQQWANKVQRGLNNV